MFRIKSRSGNCNTDNAGNIENGGFCSTVAATPTFLAAILVKSGTNSYNFTGNGIIVSNQYVLTSTMNIYNSYISDLAVRVGSSRWSSGGALYSVTLTRASTTLDQSTAHKAVSLLRLNSVITFDTTVTAIDLSASINPPNYSPTTVGKVAGWGSLLVGCTASEELQEFDLLVEESSKCQGKYAGVGEESAGCASVQGGGNCDVGIGGPIIIQNTFVGLVTYQVFSPTIVFADVSVILEFITSTTGISVITPEEEGDNPVDISDYNFQVAILVASGGNYQFIGNGVIIKERYILTTASCLKSYAASEIFIRAGSSIYTSGALYAVSQLTPHTSYDSATLDYNVAILTLETSLVFDVTIGVANLPTLGENVDVGVAYNVTGWGKATCGLKQKLQRKEIATLEGKICGRDFPGYHFGERIVCGWFLEGDGQCDCGDGAPVIYENKLLGLLAYQEKLKRSIFVKISQVIDFISEFIDADDDDDDLDEVVNDDDDSDVLDIAAYNYQVAILYYDTSNTYQYVANGALIHERYVITTASAIDGLSTRRLSVRVGSSRCDKRGIHVSVVSKIKHAEYNATDNDYDVAVLKLGWRLTQSSTVGFVKLPERDEDDGDDNNESDKTSEAGDDAFVTGWGSNGPNCKKGKKLKGKRGVTMKGEHCEKRWGLVKSQKKRALCAEVFSCDELDNGCTGGKGALLVKEGVLVGLLSQQDGKNPMKFTSVSPCVDFVKSRLKEKDDDSGSDSDDD